jgi:hypothetical protein
MKVSAFITINSNAEYLPNLLILFLSSVILILQRFGSNNMKKRRNYSKVGISDQKGQLEEAKVETYEKEEESLKGCDKWLDMLNNIRFGMILTNVIEYSMFCFVNLSKGLKFNNQNFFDAFSGIISLLLLVLYTQEILEMLMLPQSCNYKILEDNKEDMTKELEEKQMKALTSHMTRYELIQAKVIFSELKI